MDHLVAGIGGGEITELAPAEGGQGENQSEAAQQIFPSSKTRGRMSATTALLTSSFSFFIIEALAASVSNAPSVGSPIMVY